MKKSEIMTSIASSWISSANADIGKLNTSRFADSLDSIADFILERCNEDYMYETRIRLLEAEVSVKENDLEIADKKIAVLEAKMGIPDGFMGKDLVD